MDQDESQTGPHWVSGRPLMDPYGPWWTPDEAPNEPPADPHKPLPNGLFMEPQSNSLFDLAFFYGLDKFLIKDQQKLLEFQIRFQNFFDPIALLEV